MVTCKATEKDGCSAWKRVSRGTQVKMNPVWKRELVPSCQEMCRTLIQFSLVAQSCPTLCDPMNRSTPGFPVHHQLPEFTQTHIH